MPLGYGDLVDGDPSQLAQLRPGGSLLEVSLLAVLDQVPTDAQVLGHVLDRHVPGEFHRVPLKRVRVAPPRIGEPMGHPAKRSGIAGA